MHRCFVPPDWMDSWLKDHQVCLPSDAVHRLLDILRVSSQEKIALFDGRGRQISGCLRRDSNACYLSEASFFQDLASSPQIILAQAALEEAKMVETLKRGCEFGVDKFVIYAAHRSAPYCFAKLKKRVTRLVNVLVDAARQSERLHIPQLSFAEGLQSFMGPRGVFGDVHAKTRLSEILREQFKPQADFLIVIGPEGGLSEAEATFLQDSNLYGVRWGPYTQRTELSGLAAVSIFNAFCGRA